jgi:hypothetical protein
VDKRLGWQEQTEEGFKCINKRRSGQIGSLTILETQLHLWSA